jgi:hypothetical protein
MNRSSGTSFADPELVELFVDERELLAIADAIGATAPAGVERGPARAGLGRFLAAAVLVAAAAVVVLVAPWQRSHGTLADLALAAIGSGPVVHVVSETPTGGGLVDLKAGTMRPLVQRDEIWYDASRGLRRDLTTIDSKIVDDELETPQGGFVPGGRVYDCTWIAAHPVAATKAQVSCNASGNNGTKPHVVPRPKPTLDPGLAGFADGYRKALASVEAREAGTGTVDGRKVDWLVFPTSDNGTERVALDHVSHKPLLLEYRTSTTRILDIGTIAYAASDFARPRADEVAPPPAGGRSEDISTVALDGPAIGAALPGAVWAGPQIAGLPLVQATKQSLTARSFRGPTQTGAGLGLTYGRVDAQGHLDLSHQYVEIQEASSWSLLLMRGFVRGGMPPAGMLYLDPLPGAHLDTTTLSVGAMVSGGVCVTIQTNATPTTVLEAAHALTQARGDGDTVKAQRLRR